MTKILDTDHKLSLWQFGMNFLTPNAKQQQIQPKPSQFNQ
jgi:hypothetical protein